MDGGVDHPKANLAQTAESFANSNSQDEGQSSLPKLHSLLQVSLSSSSLEVDTASSLDLEEGENWLRLHVYDPNGESIREHTILDPTQPSTDGATVHPMLLSLTALEGQIDAPSSHTFLSFDVDGSSLIVKDWRPVVGNDANVDGEGSDELKIYLGGHGSSSILTKSSLHELSRRHAKLLHPRDRLCFSIGSAASSWALVLEHRYEPAIRTQQPTEFSGAGEETQETLTQHFETDLTGSQADGLMMTQPASQLSQHKHAALPLFTQPPPGNAGPSQSQSEGTARSIGNSGEMRNSSIAAAVADGIATQPMETQRDESDDETVDPDDPIQGDEREPSQEAMSSQGLNVDVDEPETAGDSSVPDSAENRGSHSRYVDVPLDASGRLSKPVVPLAPPSTPIEPINGSNVRAAAGFQASVDKLVTDAACSPRGSNAKGTGLPGERLPLDSPAESVPLMSPPPGAKTAFSSENKDTTSPENLPQDERRKGLIKSVLETLESECEPPTATELRGYSQESTATETEGALSPLIGATVASDPRSTASPTTVRETGAEEEKEEEENHAPMGTDNLQAVLAASIETSTDRTRKLQSPPVKRSEPSARKRPATDLLPVETTATSMPTRSARKRQRTGSPIAEKGSEVRVLVTTLELNDKQKKMINYIGGTFLEEAKDAHKATHVIASDGSESLKRTPKLMIAMNRTPNIVTLDWLVESAKAKKALPCDKFLILNDKEAENRYGFSMREALRRTRKNVREGSPVFGGIAIFVCDGVAGRQAPSKKELKLIVEAAGGKWLPKVDKWQPKDGSRALVVVTSSDSKHAKKQTKSKHVARVLSLGAEEKTTAWLFDSMMAQKI